MEILYDQPIEVTKDQYERIRRRFAEIVAYREHQGRYYVKLWHMAFKDELLKELQ
jgi:hypothetical protein